MNTQKLVAVMKKNEAEKDPLERIGPPFDLCAEAFRIDPEAFARSVFAWSFSCDKRNRKPFVDRREDIEFCRRGLINAPPVYPAPTMVEILNTFGNFHCEKFMPSEPFDIVVKLDPETWSDHRKGTDPTTATMQLWLEIHRALTRLHAPTTPRTGAGDQNRLQSSKNGEKHDPID